MEHQQIEKGSYRVTPNEQAAPALIAGQLDLDLSLGSAIAITLTDNITVFNPGNPEVGGAYVIRVIQGGTGSYTIDWGSSTVLWGTPGAPTLSTAVGSIDLINLYYDGTYFLGSYVLGYSLPA